MSYYFDPLEIDCRFICIQQKFCIVWRVIICHETYGSFIDSFDFMNIAFSTKVPHHRTLIEVWEYISIANQLVIIVTNVFLKSFECIFQRFVSCLLNSCISVLKYAFPLNNMQLILLSVVHKVSKMHSYESYVKNFTDQWH